MKQSPPPQACPCLKAFLLPLLIPRLRCFRPLFSCSLNARKLGSSPPFSIPAPNLSTPLGASLSPRGGLPPLPTRLSSSSSAAYDRDLVVGIQDTSTDPSLLRTTCSLSSGPWSLAESFDRCRADDADRRWPKVASPLLAYAVAAAVRPETVDGWACRGTRRILVFGRRRCVDDDGDF